MKVDFEPGYCGVSSNHCMPCTPPPQKKRLFLIQRNFRETIERTSRRERWWRRHQRFSRWRWRRWWWWWGFRQKQKQLNFVFLDRSVGDTFHGQKQADDDDDDDDDATFSFCKVSFFNMKESAVLAAAAAAAAINFVYLSELNEQRALDFALGPGMPIWINE